MIAKAKYHFNHRESDLLKTLIIKRDKEIVN